MPEVLMASAELQLAVDADLDIVARLGVFGLTRSAFLSMPEPRRVVVLDILRKLRLSEAVQNVFDVRRFTMAYAFCSFPADRKSTFFYLLKCKKQRLSQEFYPDKGECSSG
jgi:hypothetical protein